MSKRRKNAGEGYGYMFSGAFAKKADAVKKEKQRKGSFVKGTLTNQGYRYLVMTPRTNPIKRKKKITGICGAFIGGEQCTRKLGHRGPHLPQGATMRTRTRLPEDWRPNPSELIVLGANPSKSQRISLPAGSTITIRTNPMTLRENPSAEALREKFKGGAVDKVLIANEPHMPRGDYAMVGKKITLYVKPRTGGQVQTIDMQKSIAVSDETARQIYFVGGDQDISSGLHVFGALDRGNGLFEIGEARRIDYEQLKEHEYWLPEDQRRWWKHPFGEETGELPRVLFDTRHKRLLLEGGAYVVREEGIVN